MVEWQITERIQVEPGVAHFCLNGPVLVGWLVVPMSSKVSSTPLFLDLATALHKQALWSFKCPNIELVASKWQWNITISIKIMFLILCYNRNSSTVIVLFDRALKRKRAQPEHNSGRANISGHLNSCNSNQLSFIDQNWPMFYVEALWVIQIFHSAISFLQKTKDSWCLDVPF